MCLTTTSAWADAGGKVQICHFTSSDHTEFVVIDISTNALSTHLNLHGNPINGQGDHGLYDPVNDECITVD